LSTLASGPNMCQPCAAVVISCATSRPTSLSRRQAQQRCTRFHCCNAATRCGSRADQRAPWLVASPHPPKFRCPPLAVPWVRDAAVQQNNLSRYLGLRTAAWLAHQSHRTRQLAGPLMPGALGALACPGLRRVGQVFRGRLASLQRALRLLLILIHGF